MNHVTTVRVHRMAIVLAFGVALAAFGVLPMHAQAGVGTVTPALRTPAGGYINKLRSISASGTTRQYAAAHDAGVLYSEDQGASWHPTAGSADVTTWWDVARAADGTLIAGTRDGVKTLAPGAETWTSTAGSELSGAFIVAVTIRPNGDWIAGQWSETSGIWISHDAGAHWVAPAVGIPGGVRSLASAGSIICAGTYYQGLWVSTDGGVNWVQSTTGIPTGTDVPDLLMDGPDWWAATGDGLYRSVNQGLSWTQAQGGGFMGVARESDGDIDAAPWGSFVPHFDGVSWTYLETGQFAMHTNAICGAPDGSVMLGFRGAGVYRNLNPDASVASWAPANSGMPTLAISAVGFGADGRAFAGAETSDGGPAGAYFSADGGETWGPPGEPALGGHGVAEVVSLPGGSTIVAGTNGAWETSTGTSWTRLAGNNGLLPIRGLAASPSFDAVAGCGYQLLSTYHFGDGSWTPLPTSGIDDPTRYFEAIIYADDGAIVTACGDGTIYRLASGGSTWTKATLPEATWVYSLVRGRNGLLFASGTGSNVLRSADDGMTWEKVGATPGTKYSMAAASDGTLYAAATRDGLFVSGDDGESWTKLANATSAMMDCVAVSADGAHVLYGTRDGVMLYDPTAPDVTVSVVPSSPPSVNGWYRGPCSVAFGRDMIGTTHWRQDAGVWASSDSTSVQIPALEGSHTVSYYSSGASTDSAPATMTIRVDSVPPTGTAVLAGGALSTKTLKVALTSSIADTSSGVWRMRTRVNGGTWTAWKTYATNATVVLTGYDGTKKVDVQYSDRGGNILARTVSIKFRRPVPSITRPLLSTSRPKHRVTFSVSGLIGSRPGSKTTLTFYRKRSGRWVVAKRVTVVNTVVGSRSRYAYRAKLSPAGSWYVTARFLGTGAFAPVTSARKYFTLR